MVIYDNGLGRIVRERMYQERVTNGTLAELLLPYVAMTKISLANRIGAMRTYGYIGEIGIGRGRRNLEVIALVLYALGVQENAPWIIGARSNYPEFFYPPKSGLPYEQLKKSLKKKPRKRNLEKERLMNSGLLTKIISQQKPSSA